jgi:hypothetical protein
MPSSEITYTTRNNEVFTGYYTHPDGDGPFPGIVLITAIWGTDDEMKELADAWAVDGFVVSVPDIFWRVLPGPTADRDVAFDRYGKFDVDQGMLDIEDLVKDLKARPECNGKVGILGFCFGGRYAHLAAARLGVDAADVSCAKIGSLDYAFSERISHTASCLNLCGSNSAGHRHHEQPNRWTASTCVLLGQSCAGGPGSALTRGTPSS